MDFDLLLEAEKRGLLPPDKQSLLNEARTRGLVPALEGGPAPQPDTAPQVPDGYFLDPTTGAMTTREGIKRNLNTSQAEAAVGGAMQGAGFGLGDELAGGIGYLTGGPENAKFQRERTRARLEKAQEAFPKTYMAGEVGGAMVPGVVYGSAAIGKTPMRTVGRGVGVGALEGGVHGAGRGESAMGRLQRGAQDAVLGGIVGGGVTAGPEAIRAFLQNRAGKKAVKSAVASAPTSESLLKEGQGLYKQVDDAGVALNPTAVKGKFDEIVDALRAGGLDEASGSRATLGLTPKSQRMTQVFEETLDGANTVPFSKLDQVRRKAGIPASDFANKTEQKLGAEIISQLDDFVDNLPPGAVDAGDAEALPGLINKARETWHRMSKSQLVDDAIEAGEDYLSGEGSGIRNQFKRILRSDKLSRGFSDSEKALMRRVAQGTLPEQMLHNAGSGLGMMVQMLLGGSLGGIPGAVAGGAVAAGTRKLSGAVTRKNAEIARALIASGGAKNVPQIAAKHSPQLEAIVRQIMARPAAEVMAQ